MVLPFRYWAVLSAVLLFPPGRGRGEDGAPAAEDLSPGELSEAGRRDFAAGRFAEAGRHFGELLTGYGDNPEVAALIAECRPMLALCHLRQGNFEAGLGEIDTVLREPALPAPVRRELSFWRGICLLQTGAVPAAQEQLGACYADEQNDRSRRYEAFLLFGSGYLQVKDFAGAADFFRDQIPKLPPDQEEVAGRATVLLLHSLVETGRKPEALELIRSGYPRLDRFTQVIPFQLLTLSLAAQCLEQGDNCGALACLNRLWSRQRVLDHQQRQLQVWRERRDRLQRTAGQETSAFQAGGVITRLERELGEFQAMPGYDAALKLRAAQGFMGLERWREAGLVLDAAVAGLEPDPVLEQAALTAIDCWQQAGDPGRVIAAADRYLDIYGEHRRGEHVPEALFAKGEGLRGSGRLEPAERQFGDLANEWPLHPLAPQAMLMGGICELEAGRTAAAAVTFETLRRRFAAGPLHGESLFWEGVALSMERRYAEACERYARVTAGFPGGRCTADAAFELARCWHNQAKHREASAALHQWLRKYPEARQTGEARLLLAGSFMALGEIPRGVELLEAIPRTDIRLWEEAQFKTGEALRKLGRMEEAGRHYGKFMSQYPQSRRLAEAALWQARSAEKAGGAEAVREGLWVMLEKLGDDPANEGVEELVRGLPRLYRGPEARRALTARLETLAAAARRDGRKTLALRLTWGLACALERDAPAAAHNLFFSLADLLDPPAHHPQIIADCADAWRAAQGFARARQWYQDLRKWHPRAPEKDRASYGLGMLALAAQQEAEAVTWFEQCAAESVTGGPGLEARLERAGMLRRDRRGAEAAAAAEIVLGSRMASPGQKARALLLRGECAMDAGETALAVRHFERCWLSGAKFKETAARARLRHGEALEQLKDPAGALAVYRGLTGRKDLASLPPAAAARVRIAALEGGVR